MKPVIWLIGGTSEGRNLIKALASLDIMLYVSVATEYGAGLIEAQDNVQVWLDVWIWPQCRRLFKSISLTVLSMLLILMPLSLPRPFKEPVKRRGVNICG